MRNFGFITGLFLAVGLVALAAPETRAQTAYQSGGYVYYYYPAPTPVWTPPQYGVVVQRVYPYPSGPWRSYAPAPRRGVFRSFGRAVGRFWGRGRPISSRNPEFGTGRNVGMIKPWLPAGVR